MPYSLIPDELGRDPRWFALAGGRRQLRDQLQAAYFRLQCESAHHQDDGYLTAHQALDECDARVLDLLCKPVLGKAPLIHRPGDQCGEKNCIDDTGSWIDGYAYRICGFSKRNPTKAETRRNRAQKADLRDARLKAEVYDRDGGCCRYCRSGPLRKRGMGRALDRRRALQHDHVDPDYAAGPNAENFVVACARCNEHKGRRTPDEADMQLLDQPTPADAAALLARPETLLDRPTSDKRQATDNRPDNQHDNEQNNEPSFVPPVVAAAGRTADVTGEVRSETGDEPQRQPTDSQLEGSGPGRGGQPPVVSGPAQPPRSPDAPDIYNRRSRAGPPRASPAPGAAAAHQPSGGGHHHGEP